MKSDSYGGEEVAVGRIITVALAATLLMVLLASCVATVPAGHAGIPVTFGKVGEQALDSGIHFKSPVVKVVKMDTRIQKVTVSLAAFSKDIQETTVIYTVNYMVSKDNVVDMYKEIGRDYCNTVIVPNISEAVKTATAQYTAEGLISNRERLADEIEEILAQLLSKYSIEVVGTSIEDLDFTDAFTNAVEAKQVAAQDKLRAETVQAQATMEEQAKAERAIIVANAEAEKAKIAANADLEVVQIQAQAALYAGEKEAEANKKIAESLTPDLVEYYKVKQWDGQLPTTVLGGSPDVMLDLTHASETSAPVSEK